MRNAESMWSTRSEQLAHGRVISVDLKNRPITFSDVLRRWQDDPVFRAFFIALLADAPFSAFRWETPPITTASAVRPFEFVLLDSPDLASHPDPDAFAEHFGDPAGSNAVVSFPNLNNDAILVVPCPLGPLSAYGHIAAFVREAPDAQKHPLWRLIGELMQRRLGTRPVWLSTAGAGVPWLHVRLDQKPKYYGHAPHRESTRSQ
jgi:hypothetical protein